MRLVNERLFSSVVLAVCYPSISFLLFPPPFIQPRRFVLRTHLLPFLPKPLVNFFVRLYVLRFFYSSYTFLLHLHLLLVSLFLPEARTPQHNFPLVQISFPWRSFLVSQPSAPIPLTPDLLRGPVSFLSLNTRILRQLSTTSTMADVTVVLSLQSFGWSDRRIKFDSCYFAAEMSEFGSRKTSSSTV